MLFNRLFHKQFQTTFSFIEGQNRTQHKAVIIYMPDPKIFRKINLWLQDLWQEFTDIPSRFKIVFCQQKVHVPLVNNRPCMVYLQMPPQMLIKSMIIKELTSEQLAKRTKSLILTKQGRLVLQLIENLKQMEFPMRLKFLNNLQQTQAYRLSSKPRLKAATI